MMQSNKFWIRSDFIDFFKAQKVTRSLDWDYFERKYKVDPKQLNNIRGIVPISAFYGICEDIALALNDDAILFDVLYTAEVGHFYTSDYLFVCAPDLRTAIQSLVDNSPTRNNAIDYIYRETGDHGILAWRLIEGLGEWRQSMFVRAAITMRQVELVLGEEKVPVTFEIAAKPPRSTCDFLDKYGDQFQFDAQANRMLVPRELLDRPNSRYERFLYAIIKQAADDDAKAFRHQSAEMLKIFAQVSESLANGPCTLAEIARALGMSQRSLQRHLEREGTTFRSMVESVRKSAAQRYISYSDKPFKEIAFLLGYSEVSTFSRAVKSWYGVSPREYRRSRQKQQT